MQKASVKLANCYGIGSLDATFDFTKKEANIVYAPNGMMKTSFANTLQGLQQQRGEPRSHLPGPGASSGDQR